MRSIRFRILHAFVVGVLALSPLALSGCESRQGPGERVGERVDEGAKDTQRAIEDATN
jgi:hypothetical protein